MNVRKFFGGLFFGGVGFEISNSWINFWTEMDLDPNRGLGHVTIF